MLSHIQAWNFSLFDGLSQLLNLIAAITFSFLCLWDPQQGIFPKYHHLSAIPLLTSLQVIRYLTRRQACMETAKIILHLAVWSKELHEVAAL